MRPHDRLDVVFGAEPRGNYNRIRLSPVLSGEKTYDEIITHDTAWYEENRAIAEGNVVAVQEDKKAYADKGVYVEDEDTLTLTGKPVRFTKDSGDWGET